MVEESIKAPFLVGPRSLLGGREGGTPEEIAFVTYGAMGTKVPRIVGR